MPRRFPCLFILGIYEFPEACKFLHDFSGAVRVRLDEDAVEMLVAEVHPNAYGQIDKQQFGQLIADAGAHESDHKCVNGCGGGWIVL